MGNRNIKTARRRQRLSHKQNKERRENAKGKELADLKKENSQLKRQVSRLTKQVQKLLTSVEEAVEDVVESAVSDEVHFPIKSVNGQCESCNGHDVKKVLLGPISLLVCQDCGWKKKI